MSVQAPFSELSRPRLQKDAIQHPERVRFDPFFRRIDGGSNPLHHLLSEQVLSGRSANEEPFVGRQGFPTRLGRRGSGASATKRQGPKAAQHDAAAEPGPRVEQLDLGEPLQQHLEHDPGLEPCELGAQAVVDAPAEAQVR